MPIKPEIMSPAGYWPQLNAAIEAGADAVYFGLKHFTARAKVGFSLTELCRTQYFDSFATSPDDFEDAFWEDADLIILNFVQIRP